MFKFRISGDAAKCFDIRIPSYVLDKEHYYNIMAADVTNAVNIFTEDWVSEVIERRRRHLVNHIQVQDTDGDWYFVYEVEWAGYERFDNNNFKAFLLPHESE